MNPRYFSGFIATAESTTMNRQQVVKALKEILLSNDFEGKEQQENALIIAIAELLKEWQKSDNN